MNEKSEDAKVKKRREGGESYYVVTGEREGWALEVRKSWSAAQVFSVREFIRKERKKEKKRFVV